VEVRVLSMAIHHLTVEDKGDPLAICFGPLRLSRKTVRYDDIETIEIGRTAILDGWGIHHSIRRGWVWNIWGRDCVVVHLKKGVLQIGGYDTHAQQDFKHAELLREFASAVAAFFADLQEMKLMERVTLLAFSEFGRIFESELFVEQTFLSAFGSGRQECPTAICSTSLQQTTRLRGARTITSCWAKDRPTMKHGELRDRENDPAILA
jgi:hypothetical protein